ncbi:septum formation initiator family protein [Paeniglutamicibacter antarcticus]|uniref:Cell division protein FtsB n=1 Tax=Paeniglutamicibacter antarcticus TaxID=494023 RepID=A0ABP9TPQ3_9MICC
MATRRPPMPRSGDSAAGTKRPAETAAPRVAGLSKGVPGPGQEPKVVPMGQINDEGKPETVTPRLTAKKPAPKPKAPAEHAPAAKLQPQPKPKATASQRRIEDRNLLSGAVRKDERSAQKPIRKKAAGPKKPIPARSFSGRLLALSIALSVFAVLLVPSIGTYARQRDEVATMRTSIEAKQAEQEALKEQIARWDDPLYIKQQARDRINLVMPGERNYMVVGNKPEEENPGEANQSPKEVRTDLPWVDALFDSVQRAATD